MADRHKTQPKAVRMPDGLLGWYETYAAAQDGSVNAVLVAALEEFRARHSGTTNRAGRLTQDEPRHHITADCPHPKARINKGLCGACGTNVGTTKAGQ